MAKKSAQEIIEIVHEIEKLEDEYKATENYSEWLRHRLEKFDDTGLKWINISFNGEWLYQKEERISNELKQAIRNDFEMLIKKHEESRADLPKKIEALKKSLEG